MALKAGIVGLPNVGKSTLFNAITKKNILAENYPFATIEPNIGIVTVPDDRLIKLAEIYEPKRTIPTTFEFIDIAGLVEGAASGEGLGNKFLSHIREVDAIVEVVRCFDDPDIIHVSGEVDPIKDIEIINVELIMADLEIIENRIKKIEKKALATKEKDALIELDTLLRAKETLEQNRPLRQEKFNNEELSIIKPFNFITLKPIIYATNVSDRDLGTLNKHTKKVKDYARLENAKVIEMCAKIESELVDLTEVDKKAFLNDLGIQSSSLDKLIKATYDLLGLRTYFTAGVEELRAWTFKKDMRAPECAGIIHSDFQRGFIKAEVISYDDIIKFGSEKKTKEAGRFRLEGKEYIMQDGDICHFRFNV